MKMIFAFALSALSTAAFAGGVTIGGGGHGVARGSSVVLLDLAEAGLENAIYFGDTKSSERALVPLAKTLPQVQGVSVALLKQKVNDIALLDPVLGLMTIKALNKIHWKMSSRPLGWMKPDGAVSLTTVQVALRTSDEDVLINQALFSKMDAKNRVALVIHEAISAVQGFTIVDSSLARSLVARLFDAKTFAYYEGIRDQYDTDHFPSVYELASMNWGLPANYLVGSAHDASGLAWPGRPMDLTRELVFQPIYKLTWVPVDTNGLVTGAEQTETVLFKDRTTAPIALHSSCDTLSAGRKLLRAEVGFHLVDTDIAPPPADQPRSARLVMNVHYVPRTVLTFSTSPSTTIANCSPENRREVRAVESWMFTFWPLLH